MAAPRLRVMQSFRQPKPTSNPYIHMLDAALDTTPGLQHLRFDWRRALIGGVDVIHFHWPEIFLEGRRPLHRLVRRLRFQLLLWRLRVSRIAIVRTVHNLDLPSNIGRWDRRMLETVRRRAQVNIALNAHTAAGGTTVVIPHGHYIEWFRGMDTFPPVAGAVSFVGLVRRYKGVEALLDAFAVLRSRRDDVTLTVSGRPTSADLATEIRERAARTPGVALHLSYLTEPDYAKAVTASSLVVLPYVAMHNSGSVLAALSLDRPVLVPDNEVNRGISEEVGPGWVHLFAGTLTADDIERALEATRTPPAAAPALDGRDWSETGAAHLRAYRAAAGRARGGAR